MAVISRWPLYRGGRYIGSIAEVSDEGVLAARYTLYWSDRYIELAVISIWPLSHGGFYIEVVAVGELRWIFAIVLSVYT